MNVLPTLRRRAAAAVLLAAVLAMAGCSSTSGSTLPGRPAPVSAGPAGPAAATDLFVDPGAPAAKQADEWAAQGRADDAALLQKIASQPLPDWLTRPTGEVGDEARQYVRKAQAAGKRPYFVAYHIPGRDCGSYSGGGAAGDDDYRAWIDEVAGELKGAEALVVLEPDAVPQEITCDIGEERAALLAGAVETLKATGATVYLDAGNPGFVDDTGALVDALRRSGVAKADGFSLNVSNFRTTEENVRFGKELSAALGGAHFVIDTGRNGNGAVDEQDIDGGPSFCNPPGRALGQTPTLNTGDPVVDGYLWIKRVGESDGACRPGEPEAGQWMPDYALELARNAT